MVKHIVMFKLKEKNQDHIEQIVSALEGMTGKIESLKGLEVGVDFKKSERSFDIVLVTEFENQEGLDDYAVHPVHLPVIDLVRSLCSQSVVVDYLN